MEHDVHDCTQLKQLIAAEFIAHIDAEIQAEQPTATSNAQKVMLNWMCQSISDYKGALDATMEANQLPALSKIPSELSVDARQHLIKDLNAEIPTFLQKNLSM